MARYIVEITDNFLETFRVDDDGKTKVLIVKDLALVNRGIKLIPTEDVVPIVRCKDCKHCGYTSNGYDRQYIMCCNKLNLDTEIYGDFYCGYAEKMEESGESQDENTDNG